MIPKPQQFFSCCCSSERGKTRGEMSTERVDSDHTHGIFTVAFHPFLHRRRLCSISDKSRTLVVLQNIGSGVFYNFSRCQTRVDPARTALANDEVAVQVEIEAKSASYSRVASCCHVLSELAHGVCDRVCFDGVSMALTEFNN